MDKNIFPESIRVRDTGLHDDLGGAGQRIFTTAGQGYEKQTYIRDDIAKCTIEAISEINGLLSGPLTGEDAYEVVDYLIKTGLRK